MRVYIVCVLHTSDYARITRHPIKSKIFSINRKYDLELHFVMINHKLHHCITSCIFHKIGCNSCTWSRHLWVHLFNQTYDWSYALSNGSLFTKLPKTCANCMPWIGTVYLLPLSKSCVLIYCPSLKQMFVSLHFSCQFWQPISPFSDLLRAEVSLLLPGGQDDNIFSIFPHFPEDSLIFFSNFL